MLLPAVAHAWGSAAHLDFGLQVLDAMILLPPMLRRLLRRNKMDFLYGCVAADMVVGKNMASQPNHCHNWDTALKLLNRSRDDSQRALSFGFLSHLAADVVAHNYFVPVKTVESFSTRSTRHTYWEIRYDQLSSGRARVWNMMQHISGLKLPEHNRFLGRHLARSSVLLPIHASRSIFQSVMMLTSREGWRRTAAALAQRSPWKLPDQEAREFNRLAVGQIQATLGSLARDRHPVGDPTGRASLTAARLMRRHLKKLDRRRPLQEERWLPFYAEVRRGFRASMRSPLELPSIHLLD